MGLQAELQLRRGSFLLDVAFNLGNGVTGLFGPSGSGKSTLLHLIAGMMSPDSGSLKLDGRILFDASTGICLAPQHRRIGLVFQDSLLFPHLTVERNLCFGLDLLAASERRFHLHQIVDLLELDRLLKLRPRQLSGGQQQRVALGRALLASPSLLLLDEPLAALDYRLKEQILPFLRRVRDEIRIPILYVSHAINEILQLTQELLVIDQGRVLGRGRFVDVMSAPPVLALAESLGLENVLEATIVQHDDHSASTVADYFDQMLYLPLCTVNPGSRICVSVRATAIALARQPVRETSIQNQLRGMVRRVTAAGHRVVVEVDAGGVLLVEVSLKAATDLKLQTGTEVYCLIKSQSFSHLSAGPGDRMYSYRAS